MENSHLHAIVRSPLKWPSDPPGLPKMLALLPTVLCQALLERPTRGPSWDSGYHCMAWQAMQLAPLLNM